ncbi:MAG: RNA-binding S4 domain-containing protein [Bacilli bacterium]|jgi:ribosomal 50S subunit-recycling heat shock protein|nr:RNA-binding S4 domain-containing protein [Bacilli bacterium]MDD3389066.1 RNA-binding S4 domain-containing protein [Bacilli bacterium]MDD4344705.1 RNA-binding S4 domain-containing protein [Bacilli bacterium]MDD4520850.1 RNA-binding S4 domain-containing protein [Bacilli bacterium]MDY0399638.1 RNA-binding S4 domain-containing protein [Bacilli bacterium]
MRIDKYLKISRLIKRRTIAKEVVENGRIILNGRPAKPSSEVKIGDIIILNLGRHRLEVKIENIDEIATRQKSSTFYTLLKDEIIERTED